MVRTKLALVLLSREYIRSWVDSGLVKALLESGQFEIIIYVKSDLVAALDRYLDCKVVGLDQTDSTQSAKILNDLSWANGRSRSLTFQFSYQRIFFTDNRYFPFRLGIKKGTFWFLRNIRTSYANIKGKRRVIFFSILPRRLTNRTKLKALSKVGRIPQEIKDFNPDWLIIVCNTVTPIVVDYLGEARKIGIKTIVPIDGWDNLTSKSVFALTPNYLTVMGELCVNHAVVIHEIDSNSVLPLGLPRFDLYRSNKRNGGKVKNSTRKRVLYAGFSLAHSEKRVVDTLANYLDARYGLGFVEVHYRPHPQPVPRIDDYEIRNPSVVVTEHGDLSRTGLPQMGDEFISAITEADVVVGAPTTLMLEAMLVGRPCVLDITSDKFHRTTAGNASHRYTHMKDLLAVNELARGETIEQLTMEVSKILDADIVGIDYEIGHLYDTTAASYAEQLTSVLLAR